MEALLNNFIKATGWSIFHSLWQGALIYGVLLLVVTLFPRLKSRLKHNLAYGALCLIFTGFCVTFFSLFNLPVEVVVSSVAKAPAGLLYAQYLAELPPDLSSIAELFFPYIVAIYALGLIIQSILLFSGYQKIRQLKQASRIDVPAEWALAFISIKNSMKISRTIGFYLSEKVNVPLVIGYFKPVVLFPLALAAHLEIKQVEAILIHELSHIRRNDYLFNLAKTVMETVLFFNPFIWLSGKLINIEREHACDDLVLKHTGTPLTYAHALLKLELLKHKDAPVLSLAATGKTQHLYQRIKRITDMKTNYMNTKQRLMAITFTLASIISLAWVSPMKTEKTTQQTRTESTETVSTPTPAPIKEISPLKMTAAAKTDRRQDTTKKKTKVKIVVTDAKGDEKEYSSIKEMPDSLKKEVRFRVFASERMPFSADSIQWKKFAEDMEKNAKDLSQKFKSPEWKKNLEDIEKNLKEMKFHFNSPEFKAHTLEFRRMESDVKKRVNSEEFRKQMEELREFQNSKEYKELKEKQKRELDRLKRKKGIKTDLAVTVSSVKAAIDADVVTLPFAFVKPAISITPAITIAPAPPATPIR